MKRRHNTIKISLSFSRFLAKFWCFSLNFHHTRTHDTFICKFKLDFTCFATFLMQFYAKNTESKFLLSKHFLSINLCPNTNRTLTLFAAVVMWWRCARFGEFAVRCEFKKWEMENGYVQGCTKSSQRVLFTFFITFSVIFGQNWALDCSPCFGLLL